MYVEVISTGETLRSQSLSDFLGKLQTSYLSGRAVTGLVEDDSLLAQSLYGRNLLPGEVGCAESHKNAYQDFLTTREAVALILEDDAVPHGFDILGDIETLRCRASGSSMPMVIHLGVQAGFSGSLLSCFTKVRSLRKGEISRSWVPPTGTFAYIINRGAAEILCSNRHIPSLADWPVAAYTGVHFFFSRRLFSHEDSQPGTIGLNRELIRRRHNLISRFKIGIRELGTPVFFRLVATRKLVFFFEGVCLKVRHLTRRT